MKKFGCCSSYKKLKEEKVDQSKEEKERDRDNLQELQKTIWEREQLEQKILKEQEEKMKQKNQNLMKF